MSSMASSGRKYNATVKDRAINSLIVNLQREYAKRIAFLYKYTI